MRKRASVLLWVLVAVVLVALFSSTAVRRLRKEEVRSVQSVREAEGVPVDYIVAAVRTIGNWRSFAGVAEGYEQVDLAADFRTRVSAVHANVGDAVPKGKVVVSLDEFDPARIMVNLVTARAQYLTARRDSLRMEELFKSGAISQQQLDYAVADAERAGAAYATARRAVQLDSPVAGVVTALYVEAGEYADAGQVLATVASYDTMKVRLDVSATERALIRRGQKVRVPVGRESGLDPADAATATCLQGAVENVSLSADTETRLFRVDLIIDNSDHAIEPGALVSPEILVATSPDRPVVPSSAVLVREGRETVYVIAEADGEHRAELREIVTGTGDGTLSSVAEGLDPGEWVVVWGQGKLRDGIKVKPHEDLTAEFFEGDGHEGGLK